MEQVKSINPRNFTSKSKSLDRRRGILLDEMLDVLLDRPPLVATTLQPRSEEVPASTAQPRPCESIERHGLHRHAFEVPREKRRDVPASTRRDMPTPGRTFHMSSSAAVLRERGGCDGKSHGRHHTDHQCTHHGFFSVEGYAQQTACDHHDGHWHPRCKARSIVQLIFVPADGIRLPFSGSGEPRNVAVFVQLSVKAITLTARKGTTVAM
jgi:hypothetical protein